MNKIYNILPVFIQNVAITLYGYYWRRQRFGGVFNRQAVLFQAREAFSSEEWLLYQNTKLRVLLNHANNTVPFYKVSFEVAGIDKKKLNEVTVDTFKTLPFLSKNDLRRFGTTSLLSSERDETGKFYCSSGSTGTPVEIYLSRTTHQIWSAAFEARIRNWAGINFKTPRGMIGGRRVLPGASDGPPFHRYNLAEEQVYFSAYHISPTNAVHYLSAMRKHKIEYMTGYAMSNYLLAFYLRNAGFKAPKLKAVITSSEKLTPDMRLVLEEVYQCKVYDSWSGVEACALVSECEYGSLHVSEDVGIVEILDEYGNEVPEGATGEVVCTGLLNFDQPLIRYRIGDRMTKLSGTCKCGRNMRMIKEIDGRLEDIVTGPDGRQMVRFHGIFVGIPSIELAQIVQHSLNYIEVKVKNSVVLKEEEVNLIKSRLVSQLGAVNIEINQKADIFQTSNGKFKAVVSHIGSRS